MFKDPIEQPFTALVKSFWLFFAPHCDIYFIISLISAATTFYGLCLHIPYVLAMKLSFSEIHNTEELFLQNDSSTDHACGSLIASNGCAPIRQGMSTDLKALNAELNCKSELLAAREWGGEKKGEKKKSGCEDGNAFLTVPLTLLPICMSTGGPFCNGNQRGLAG